MRVLKVPSSVISLVPSITESLFDMGLGQYVVGITDYCIFPADKVGKITKVGGPKSVKVPLVCDLKPDLILANQEENSKEAIEALIAQNQPVVMFFPKTVDQAIQDLYQIGKIFQNSRSIQIVQSLEKSIEWLRLSSENIRTFRYFCPIWQGVHGESLQWWMTFNEEVYASDLLRLFGGINCFAGRTRRYPLEADLGLGKPERREGRDERYPRVTREEIIAADPDVIILPTEPYPYKAHHVSLFEKLFVDLKVEKPIKVVLVDGTLITWHGTRISHSLRQLPAILQCKDMTNVR